MATWGSGGIFDRIGRMVGVHNIAAQNESNEAAQQASLLAAIRAYVQYGVQVELDSTWRGFDNSLQTLIDNMEAASETINENTVTAGAVSYVGDANYRIQDNGTPTLDQVTPTQMLLDDDIVRIQCTSANRGSDSWSVNSQIRGSISGTCKTGVLYPKVYDRYIPTTDRLGYEFTILEPVSEVVNDGGAIIADPTDINIVGAVKDTNCDSDGTVYIDISEVTGTYTFAAYASSADRTGGLAANRVFEFEYTATGEHTIEDNNGSGLTGSITIDALATDADIEMTLKVDYQVGEYFEIAAATVVDGGVFQTFFRDEIGKTLPSDSSPTIPDSLVI